MAGLALWVGGVGYNGAAKLPRCEEDMLDKDGRAGYSGPLERGLDLSAMAVPLYWAEGVALRVCGIGYNRAAEIAALRGGYVGYGWAGRLLRAVGQGA